MEGTSVNQYIDETLSHDHTYFGNGCNVAWNEGSTTSCDTRLAHTKDNDPETQLMGVYYNLQAVSSGSGAAITANNAVMPDTFCPLGWQLPYGGTDGDYYDQSKSWKYLLDAYSLVSDISSITKFRSYPLSYILPGYFTWNKGMLYNQKSLGDYWSLTISTEANTFFVRVVPSESLLSPQQQSAKAGGRTIRCVNNFSIPFSRSA